MEFIVGLTNRAVLLSAGELQFNKLLFACGVDELSHDECEQIAARLHDDKYICKGVVNDDGEVEPRLDGNGQPVLLRLSGTEIGDLTDALEADEREIREYLAQRAAEKKTA